MLPSVEDLFLAWGANGNSAGKVTMFNVLFLNTVARPEGKQTGRGQQREGRSAEEERKRGSKKQSPH